MGCRARTGLRQRVGSSFKWQTITVRRRTWQPGKGFISPDKTDTGHKTSRLT
jgi:hypothetical protein